MIPKHSISSDSFEPRYDENGLLEDDVYWAIFPTSVSLFQGVEKILPRSKSWSKDLQLFGSEESNCLEVYRKNGYIASVSLRVDFTSDYEAFLRAITEFIYLKELLLLDESNNVLAANYLSIRTMIENSQQFKKYEELRSN